MIQFSVLLSSVQAVEKVISGLRVSAKRQCRKAVLGVVTQSGFSLCGINQPMNSSLVHSSTPEQFAQREGFLDLHDWLLLYRVRGGNEARPSQGF